MLGYTLERNLEESIRWQQYGSRKLWDEGLKWPISAGERRSCLLIRPPLSSPIRGRIAFPSFDLVKRKNNKRFHLSQPRNGKESVFRVRLKVARFLGFPKDAIPLDPDYASIFSSMYLRRGKRKGSDPASANDTAPRWPPDCELSPPLAAQPWIKFSTLGSSIY